MVGEKKKGREEKAKKSSAEKEGNRIVVLSGMRPTGNLHVGHLKGVLDIWRRLQED